MTQKKTCSTCTHSKVSDPEGAKLYDLSDYMHTCHRYPPNFVTNGRGYMDWEWPAVMGRETCGEHARKYTKAEREYFASIQEQIDVWHNHQNRQYRHRAEKADYFDNRAHQESLKRKKGDDNGLE